MSAVTSPQSYEELIEPYSEAMNWLNSHDIHQALRIVDRVFSDMGSSAGWRFLGEYWDWFEATYVLSLLVKMKGTSEGRVHRYGVRNYFMKPEEQQRFRKLPKQLTIYRGGCGPDVERGLSWTLDRATAEWFARHSVSGRRAMFGFAVGAPRVVKAEVHRRDVIGLKLGRKEYEVVTLPQYVRILP